MRTAAPAVGLDASDRSTQDGRSIQPKLTVNKPGDEYEREAERVADAVMRLPEPESAVDAQEEILSGRIQRMCPRCQRRQRRGKPLNCEECEQEVRRRPVADDLSATDDVEQAAAVASEPGKPLSGRTRSFFEERMGRDFSDVRVHTGGEADQAARSINAEAFTYESNIVFKGGNYRPDDRGGRRLIAHELTHVAQQSGSKPEVQRQVSTNQQSDDKRQSPGRTGSGPGRCPPRSTDPDEYQWDEKQGLSLVKTNELSLNRAAYQIANQAGVKGHSRLLYGFDIGSTDPSSGAGFLKGLLDDKGEDFLPIGAETQVSFYGFADCHGSYSLNASLRRTRAENVYFEMAPLNSEREKVTTSRGEVKGMPVGTYPIDNDSKESRAKNRGVIIIEQVVGEKGVFPEFHKFDDESRKAIDEAKKEFREKGQERYLKVLEFFEDESLDMKVYTSEHVRWFAKAARESREPDENYAPPPDYRAYAHSGRKLLRGEHPSEAWDKYPYLARAKDPADVRGAIIRFMQEELGDGIQEALRQKGRVQGNVVSGPDALLDHINDLSDDPNSIYNVLKKEHWPEVRVRPYN